MRNMNRMFYNARQFNSDLNSWNISQVIDLKLMFYEATAFDSKNNIRSWKITAQQGSPFHNFYH